MKKFLAVIISVVVVLSMALPTFAASGINSNEEALLAKFSALVMSWDSVLGTSHKDGGRISAEYISEAENALTQVDLDAAACADLSAAIDAAEKVATDAGAKTRADLGAILPDVLKVVNATSEKYGMTVTVDYVAHGVGSDYATVTITTPKGQTSGGSTKPAVNQTGAMGMGGTYAVLGGLFAAFIVGIVLISRRRAAER
ncbi:MAG: hypothetical protein IKG67_13035 [Parasporobacterium sp.]|nr:hypothetical protein [Parasporobacterium sp.]